MAPDYARFSGVDYSVYQRVEIVMVNPAKIVRRLKMWRIRRNGTETFLIFLSNFSYYYIDKLLINLAQLIWFF